MNRFLIIAIALGISAGSVGIHADGVADNPLARAGPHADVVRGRFHQEKYLAELEQPLTSSGSFLVTREQGLLWQVEQPFETTLIIDRQHMVQRVRGRETLRLSRDEQPALSVVAAVLVAVFQADLDRLRDLFDIRIEHGEGEGWRAVMQPNVDSVAEFVEHLSVAGADEIERIELQEPGGDRSIIRLQVAPGPVSPPTSQERREFVD